MRAVVTLDCGCTDELDPEGPLPVPGDDYICDRHGDDRLVESIRLTRTEATRG